MSVVAYGSEEVSAITTIIFAAVMVMVGLVLVAVAKDLRVARDQGEPPTLPEWHSAGWYERRPAVLRVSASIMVGVGSVLLVVGVVLLAGTVA